MVLHALEFGRSGPLLDWIAQRPNNAVTVLDTHDGIGIIDIGADASNRAGRPGLVPPAELDQLVDEMFAEVDRWIAAGMPRPERGRRKLSLPVVGGTT